MGFAGKPVRRATGFKGAAAAKGMVCGP